MGVDWREAEPAVLAIGPVVSLEDAVGNKLSALYSRAYARDFLDADQLDAIKNRFDVWASKLVEGSEDYGQVNRNKDTWLGR